MDRPNAPTAAPEPQAIEALWQIVGSKFVAKSLYAAARVGVADQLVAGPLPVEELARRTETHASSLYRILRALASVGVFTETTSGTFANTPMSELIVDSPHSIRPMILWIHDPRHDHLYESLLHSVRTGETAVSAMTGKPVWEYLQSDADLHAIFNRAMTSNASGLHRAVPEVYDFSGIRTLVDVGGGHGHLLATILKANPQLQGIVFDLPSVAVGARKLFEELGVADRARIETGDFFQAVPAGDAHIMSFIIHDWLDEPSAAILRNIHAAQPKDGRVILVESVIPPGNEPHFGKFIDIEMLALANGRERRADEFEALFANAGYRLSRIIPTPTPCSVIEAVKRS